MTRRELALNVAWKNYGKPYVWGGDDPIAGWDCSGYVVEILQSCGVMKHGSDDTANGLMGRFPKVEEQDAIPGDLVFWLRFDGTARHVELVVAEIAGQVHSIGFSGGGSSTHTLQDAIEDNAFCKIRPVTYRSEPRVYCNPWGD